MLQGGVSKNNVLLTKQPGINNNMMITKMLPNGPMSIGVRGQLRNQSMGSIPPGGIQTQRLQV